MGGIAGFLLPTTGAQVPADRIKAMIEALGTQPPNGKSIWMQGPIGIGAQWMSKPGLQVQHGVITNETSSIHAVFTGMCYNLHELRTELLKQGHRFSTDGQTEVVVHGFEEWGIERLLHHLDGAYAFCIWDYDKRTAYLARDRLGREPIYFVVRNNGFAFSSELRSLALSGLLLPKLDEQALWAYLVYQYVPTERTLLASATKLLPGHFLIWRNGNVNIQKYWDLPCVTEKTRSNIQEWAEKLRSLLQESVKRHMANEAPIGCFLSEGFDSILIASLVAQLSEHPFQTFSLLCPDQTHDDRASCTEQLAQRIGARHKNIRADGITFLQELNTYFANIDEPIGDVATLPMHLISEPASEDVTLLFAGYGGDEVLGGRTCYRKVDPPRRSNRFASLDQKRLTRWLNHCGRISERIKGWMPAPLADMEGPCSGPLPPVNPEFAWCLLGLDKRASLDIFREALTQLKNDHHLHRLGMTAMQRNFYDNFHSRLPHAVLPALKNATRGLALEIRLPFLDHQVVEQCFARPASFSSENDIGVRILQETARTLAPELLTRRNRKIQTVPLDVWFRGSLRNYLSERLINSLLVKDGFLTRQGIEAILYAHGELNISMGQMIWGLLCLEGWWTNTKELLSSAALGSKVPHVSTKNEAKATPSLSETRDPQSPKCDIVIPIHEGLHHVRDLVHSIQSFTRAPFRTILIDDGSNPATYEKLRALIAGDERFELHHNLENLGFLRTCNRGLQLSDAKYVCLLNSDTVVTTGWLERLIACAESDPRIAIVNPLTNQSAGTSIRMPPGYNLHSMARKISDISRRCYPDITTAVGYCLLLRREWLNLLGGFDEIFGHGYCEESDLSMRCTEAGLRAVAADNAFIYHRGWASYSATRKKALYTNNRAIFDGRWSVAYQRDYRAFLRNNPLQYIRNSLYRYLISSKETDPECASIIDEQAQKLTGKEILAASNNGTDLSVFTRMLSHLSPVRNRARFQAWKIRRHSRPLMQDHERKLGFPTRTYIESFPKTEGLRITFLVWKFTLAGGMISVFQLAREMMLAGHDVKIVTESGEKEPERFNLWTQPLVFPSRNQLFDLFPPSDVVIATFWPTAHHHLPELRNRYNFTSVYFIQDYEPWFYEPVDLENRNRVGRTYRNAEHHIVKSHWLAEKIKAHGYSPEIIPLGLDLDVFYPRTRKLEEKRLRVVSAAYPDYGKRRRGFKETLAVFTRIHKARPDVELVLFGAPRDRLPRFLGFPCTVVGPIEEQQKVAELISSCDVLVDASYWQGFGRPGLEAMACGTACVLTNVGGLHEYVRHEENCLLVPPQNVEAMTQAVLRLLGDESMRERFVAVGIETAQRFSHIVEAKRHMECYERWVRERHASGRAGWCRVEQQTLVGPLADAK